MTADKLLIPPEWLTPGAIVPVDIATTGKLLAALIILNDKIKALAEPAQSQDERKEYEKWLRSRGFDPERVDGFSYLPFDAWRAGRASIQSAPVSRAYICHETEIKCAKCVNQCEAQKALESAQVFGDEKIAMHIASKCGAWEKWESAKDFCDTPSGNDPQEERDYWIGIVSTVRALLTAEPVKPNNAKDE